MRKRKKTLKRTAALMAAILMLNNTNMSVFALSVTQDEQTKMVTMTSAPETELPENDELFWYFAEEKLYDYEMATFGTRAREGLNDAEKAIYDELKSRIVTVANNGGSTVFEIDLSGISSLKTTWTNTDLEVDSISNSILNQVGDAFEAQFDFNSIIEALLDDCPFELYWYDKTGGARQNYSISGTSAAVSIINFQITFTVATEYKSGENMVTTDVSKVNTAKNNAQTVVNANASKSDYEKLVAYKEYICNAVS